MSGAAGVATRERGECEALRLLRVLVEGSEVQRVCALGSARRLIEGLRGPVGAGVSGRRLRRVSVRQLLRMAVLDARGVEYVRIAGELGLDVNLVRHHLMPSGAMLSAMIDGPLGEVAGSFNEGEVGR